MINIYNQKVYPIQNKSYNDTELYIPSIGIFQSGGQFKWEQITTEIVIHIITKGSGYFQIGKNKYQANKGSVIVARKNQHIKYYDISSDPWSYTWFYLKGEKAEDILKETGIVSDLCVKDLSQNNIFWSWLLTLESFAMTRGSKPFYSTLKAWEFVSFLNDTNITTNKKFNIAEECKIMIDNQLAETLSVSTLAQHFKINRITLYRIFKESFKISPKEYIDKCRLKKACNFLTKSNLSIKEIADLCGYKNASYFSLSFKKKFGVAPTQWNMSRKPR